MQHALRNIRVLDCGRYIAGPFCGSLLAECGADVIRVEPTSGSPDRFVTPIAEDGSGAYFLQVNRHKRSIAMDLSCPNGRAILKRLIKSADVVIANLPLPELKNMGLDSNSVKEINDRAILVTTSAFGNSGPYQNHVGFDGIAQAMSGLMHLTGPRGQPSKAMYPFVDFMTAVTNAFGVMVALRQRDLTNKGDWLATSLMKSAMTVAGAALAEQSALQPNRMSTWNRSPVAAPSDTYQSRDGWLMIQVIGNSMFRRWATLVDRKDVLSDTRFATDLARGNHGSVLSEIMANWVKEKRTHDALKLLAEHRIPAGPVYSPQEALQDQGFHEAGLFVPNNYPGTAPGSLLVGPLLGEINDLHTRAPKLGEHSVDVLKELGYSDEEIQSLLALETVSQADKDEQPDTYGCFGTNHIVG